MPVTPKPRVYKCKECRWKKVVYFTSDVLLPNQIPTACLGCGSKDLISSEVGAKDLPALVISFITRFKRP
jgi:hypothetical protein